MPSRMVPKERRFFALFREAVDNLQIAINALALLLSSESDFAVQARKLRDLEHLGDEITHRIIRELNTSFVTPFDREDIYALASKLDDVLDLVEETADTIVLDGITSITGHARDMGRILTEIAEEIVLAVGSLDQREGITPRIVRIHDLENQGDRITREAIGSLFQTSTDAMYVIKWKDVYALLEKTVDTTEDIANVLENLTIKNT